MNYSDELVKFIDDNRMKFNVEILCEMINKEFNKFITPKTLRKYFYRHGLDYKKKIKPKIIRAYNSKPIGYESNPDKNGLIRVKVTQTSWMYKQRYIYEKHYGSIPKGYNVIFLNSDKTDFRIENLGLIKISDMKVLYCRGLNSKDSDVTKLGIEVSKLFNEIKRKRNI